MQKYVRLLNYENACKVVEFVNRNNNKENYANIVTGGISIQTCQLDWDEIETFIKSLGVRYEINDETPYQTKRKIVEGLNMNVEEITQKLINKEITLEEAKSEMKKQMNYPYVSPKQKEQDIKIINDLLEIIHLASSETK